jgi:hypothetical protein
LQHFQEGYLTTSGSDGRFTLALHDLPVGEMVPFRSHVAESLGTQAVSSTLDVCAVTDSEHASARVDVLDRRESVSVTLRMGSIAGVPAGTALRSTGTASPPARTRPPHVAPRGRSLR